MDSLRKNEKQFLSASDMFILNQNQAPWRDIPRAAGLLGPAEESGFRINTHNARTVVILIVEDIYNRLSCLHIRCKATFVCRTFVASQHSPAGITLSPIASSYPLLLPNKLLRSI